MRIRTVEKLWGNVISMLPLYLVEMTRVADHTFQVTCVLIGNAPFEGDARINLI